MSEDHSSLVSVGAELACYPFTGATSCDPAISPYLWDEDRAWDAADAMLRDQNFRRRQQFSALTTVVEHA